ncbi:MAG: MFS transporter [Runella slithyformis]|nr:MAG: MFS transporter [Runella slithyformis]
MTAHLRTYFSHSRSLALGGVFASMGFLFGNWVTLIPYVKVKFSLDDAQLGVLLLSMPFVSTLMNPFTTLIINRFGMKNATVYGLLAMTLAYALPVNMPYLWLTALTLALVGATLSTTNVAMNTCVNAIEQHERLNIMSTSHGMFSAGGMLGAALASTFIGLKIPALAHMAVVSGLVLGLIMAIRPAIFSIYEEKTVQTEGAKFAWPSRVLVGMIAISLCTNITEGTMADWTAVFMRDVVKTDDFFIGWAFSGYAFLMAAGRFLGDSFIPKYGTKRILVVGGILTSAGILLAVLWPHTVTAIVGFGLVGAGVSCGAPILYGSAARVPGMAKGAGLATMNTFSIAGFLAGPAIIGFISNAVSLSIAVGLVAILGLIWAFLASKVRLY